MDLEDGTYVLHEEAASADGKITDADGNTYKVIKSDVEFTVHNGTVTSSNAVSSFDDVDKKNGGAVVDGTKLTIADAETDKVFVHINKTDVTGQTEVEGAQLTITDKKS